jgi:hypothetical protein
VGNALSHVADVEELRPWFLTYEETTVAASIGQQAKLRRRVDQHRDTHACLNTLNKFFFSLVLYKNGSSSSKSCPVAASSWGKSPSQRRFAIEGNR